MQRISFIAKSKADKQVNLLSPTVSFVVMLATATGSIAETSTQLPLRQPYRGRGVWRDWGLRVLIAGLVRDAPHGAASAAPALAGCRLRPDSSQQQHSTSEPHNAATCAVASRRLASTRQPLHMRLRRGWTYIM